MRSRRRLILGLAVVNLLLTYAATQPLSAALSTVMDHRPAASAMINGNDALLGELAADHPDAFAGGFAAAQALMLLWGLLAWMLAGGILATVALPPLMPARGSLRELLSSTAEYAWRMCKLGALGLTLRLVPLLLAGAVWFSLKPIFNARGFAPAATWMVLTCLVFALTWGWSTVALDYARTLALTEPIKVWRAFFRGIRRSLRGPTVMIVIFSLTGFAAITLLQAAIGHKLPAEPAWSAVVAFLIRVVAALGRTAVSVTALVAAGLAARPGNQPA